MGSISTFIKNKYTVPPLNFTADRRSFNIGPVGPQVCSSPLPGSLTAQEAGGWETAISFPLEADKRAEVIQREVMDWGSGRGGGWCWRGNRVDVLDSCHENASLHCSCCILDGCYAHEYP